MTARAPLFWAVSGQAVTLVLTFTGSVILARLLSPREMGVYAVANATVGVIAILSTLGINSYIIREVKLASDVLATAFTLNALINIAIAGMIFFGSYATQLFVGDAAVGPILRVLALVPILSVLEFRPAAMLQRDMAFKPIAVISTMAAGIVSGVQIILAMRGFSSMSMAYANIAGVTFRAIVTSVAGWRYVSLRLSLADWRPITGFGLRMLTIGGVASIAQRASELILARTLGLVAIGLYSRASTISNLIFANIYGTATRVVFAKLSQEFRENGQVGETFLRYLELIICIMWPMLIGLAVLSEPVFDILYGQRWLHAAPVFSLLMIAQFVVLCFGMNWELFVIHDEIRRQTRYEAIRALAGTAVFAIGCLFSIEGAAVGRIVEAAFGLALYLPHMSRIAGTKPSQITRVYSRALLVTVAAVLPVFVLMAMSGWRADVSRPLMALCIALGGTAWLVTLWLIDHALIDEMRKIARALAELVTPRPTA